MNTQEEYLRLKKIAQTPEGWQQIDDAWSTAIGMKKVDGEWIKVQSSAGSLVEGFAIDVQTKKFAVGTTDDHSRAYFDLYEHIQDTEPTTDCDEIECRLIKGWRGNILDFEAPCICMASQRLFWEPGLLEKIEESILTQGIGLPLNHLYFEKIRR